MKTLFTFLFVATVLFASAQQDTGIHFTHSANWQQVLEKAKAENKFIFVDAYTTWCGPCRQMAKAIFPLKDVGDFYNDHYISIKVQLDTTQKDNEDVKGWYADAHNIMTNYKVNVFPTYLFLSPEGKLVHRAVGSSEASVFIGKGSDALDPNKQYYTLVDRFNKGEREPEFLKNLAEAALNAYDRPSIPVFSAAYISTQKDLLTEPNIKFLDNTTQSSKDPGFEIIRKNTAAYNKVLGAGKAEVKIKEIVLNEEVYPSIFGSADKPDWVKLEASLSKKYPALAKELTANAKVLYYYNKEDWPTFSKTVTQYVKDYGKSVSANELNQYAWRIFENCSDAACVNQALEWSKRSVDITNSHMFIDTYANLLYKTGKKQQALAWEEKALKLAKDANEDFSSYEEVIEKIKKGEKTW
jgi:thioredoxin-related protein